MIRRSSTDLTVNSSHVDYFQVESRFKRKNKFQFRNATGVVEWKLSVVKLWQKFKLQLFVSVMEQNGDDS